MSNNNVDSIIQGLKQKNIENAITFTLPFSKIEVELKPLQSKHTSMVNSSLLSSNDGSYALKFTNFVKTLFNDILVLKDDKSYGDFGLYDLHYIILKIRESINPIIKQQTEDGVEIVFDVKQILSRYETNKYEIEGFMVEYEGCNIYVEPPTFKDVLEYDNILIASHKKFKDTDTASLATDAIGFTLLKFIKTISMVVDNEKVLVDLEDITPMQRRNILNHLPNKAYSEIIETIKNITDPIESVLKSDNDDVLTLDQTIFIDV